MRMRTAAAEEAEALARLINAAFLVERFFVEGDRIRVEQVQAYLAKGEFLVAEDRGEEPAGCAYIEMRGQRSYLGLLSIDPARQRSGLGSRLVAAAEERCRKLGSRFMDLQIVNVREELPGFYGRLGYVETGTAPFTAGVPTRMPCHFVKMSKAL